MTALVQAASTSAKPILFHFDSAGGHSAGLPIVKRIENSAGMLAFSVSRGFPDK